MSGAEHVWAHTEPGVIYPAYINMGTNAAGMHMLTVRERGHGGERTATIEMQPQQMRELAEALLMRLARLDDLIPAVVLDRVR